MRKLLERFEVGKAGREAREKKLAQLRRLLNRDFPWLWAVRNDWSLNDSIDVWRGVSWFRRFLIGDSCGNAEVWVRSGNKNIRPLFPVIRAEPREQMCWAEAILSAAGLEGQVTHVVLVLTDHLWRMDGSRRRAVEVHLPPRKEATLNSFLKKVVEEWLSRR